MEEEARVYAEPIEREQRLRELGLDESALLEAVRYGQRYALECTLNDPPTLPGILAWGKTNRHLRDRLTPLGWKRDNTRNYPSTVHPDGSFAIVTCGGNINTGKRDKTPAPRSDKGTVTKDAVARNQHQLNFGDFNSAFAADFAQPIGQLPEALTDIGTRLTWLLMYCRDADEQETRSELALPDEITKSGFIYSWRERIILPATPFTPIPVADEEPLVPDIDVSVERR